jgi:hypothetical protein
MHQSRTLLAAMALAIGLMSVGCQESVVRTNNPYAMDPNRGSPQQRSQSAHSAHLRLNSHSRHQAAKNSSNPFASIGAFFGDLADLFVPPARSAPLSSKRTRPSTSFGGTNGGG